MYDEKLLSRGADGRQFQAHRMQNFAVRLMSVYTLRQVYRKSTEPSFQVI